MHPLAQKIYAMARAEHGQIYNRLAELRQYLDRCPNQGELADAAYALRKAGELLEDTRKEVKRVEELAIKIACVLWVRDPANLNGKPIKTQYVTASPNVVDMPRLPSRRENPNQFFELLTALGVPQHLQGTDDESSIIVPHWPGLLKHVEQLAGEGKPLPAGLDSTATYPVYKMTLRGGNVPIDPVELAEPTQEELQSANRAPIQEQAQEKVTAQPAADQQRVKFDARKGIDKWVRNLSRGDTCRKNHSDSKPQVAELPAQPPVAESPQWVAPSPDQLQQIQAELRRKALQMRQRMQAR